MHPNSATLNRRMAELKARQDQERAEEQAREQQQRQQQSEPQQQSQYTQSEPPGPEPGPTPQQGAYQNPLQGRVKSLAPGETLIVGVVAGLVIGAAIYYYRQEKPASS